MVVAKVGRRPESSVDSSFPSFFPRWREAAMQYTDRGTRESVRGQRSLKEMKAAAKCVLSGGAGARAGEWGGKFALHLSRVI